MTNKNNISELRKLAFKSAKKLRLTIKTEGGEDRTDKFWFAYGFAYQDAIDFAKRYGGRHGMHRSIINGKESDVSFEAVYFYDITNK